MGRSRRFLFQDSKLFRRPAMLKRPSRRSAPNATFYSLGDRHTRELPKPLLGLYFDAY